MENKTHNENVIEQFSKQASNYTSIVAHRDALEELITISFATKEDNVLDIACGSGIVSCEFAKHVNHVTGIDITQEMINEAKKLQAKFQLKNIDWEIGEVTSLPYPDNNFSIVVSRFGLHHFLNPQLVLTEMIRVCKPDGIVMVVDVALPDNKIDAYNMMEKNRDSSHVKALSVKEFEMLFEKSNLKGIKQSSYTLKIELEEQLKASFPENSEALREMILEDIGIDNLGVNATKIDGKVFLHYPICIFSGMKV
ncbi:class I SAM-dependent methyltransferase [Flavobacterium sp. 5]|uniref:class I SAM-dependent methyltransferase n=1 Tax=Flavobacterium sp. 5 TaxID=2035199 RepID=UPI000C2C6D3D|nr:methyltransferase domain-containing protein [Flavobacterium sp. 5]PKB17742.1 methyltransferase family protein [Flavobacterium sp. 5]